MIKIKIPPSFCYFGVSLYKYDDDDSYVTATILTGSTILPKSKPCKRLHCGERQNNIIYSKLVS